MVTLWGLQQSSFLKFMEVANAIVKLSVLNIPPSPIIIVGLLSVTDDGGVLVEGLAVAAVTGVVAEVVNGLVTALVGETAAGPAAFVLLAADEVMDTVA